MLVILVSHEEIITTFIVNLVIIILKKIRKAIITILFLIANGKISLYIILSTVHSNCADPVTLICYCSIIFWKLKCFVINYLFFL